MSIEQRYLVRVNVGGFNTIAKTFNATGWDDAADQAVAHFKAQAHPFVQVLKITLKTASES